MSNPCDTSSWIDLDDADLSFSPASAEEGTPLTPIVCLKRKEDIKKLEELEDCFILDFDPEDPVDLGKLAVSAGSNAADVPDISVVAEKGQLACRDYPHPRHNCVKYPFEQTPHETYCEVCYCYVCNVAAPCTSWNGVIGHCHAIANEAWKTERARNVMRGAAIPVNN